VNTALLCDSPGNVGIGADEQGAERQHGLYVVQRIVEQLGGSVTCESSSGEGSTLVVTLPRARA
jgi:sensor histidine kinase regulating citrate/malate metabolism